MQRFLFVVLAGVCVMNAWESDEAITRRFDTFTMKVNGELVLADPSLQSLDALRLH